MKQLVSINVCNIGYMNSAWENSCCKVYDIVTSLKVCDEDDDDLKNVLWTAFVYLNIKNMNTSDLTISNMWQGMLMSERVYFICKQSAHVAYNCCNLFPRMLIHVQRFLIFPVF